MENIDFIRCSTLNNIPQRKLHEAIKAIENSQDDLQTKAVKLTAVNRYTESNIPLEYWTLKMDQDFKGDPRLLERYKEYVVDLKAMYVGGTSICFAGGHGTGKQLCLETDLPTPAGFIKLKDLKEGDQLFDEQGNICNVSKLHPINMSPESYRITFDDGTIVDACADHQWLTYTREDRKRKKQPTIKNTKKILETLRFNNGIRKAANHSIPCAAPIKYLTKDLLIDPYVLGIWLGDGLTLGGNIESADEEILRKIEKIGYSINLIKSTKTVKSKSAAYRIGDLVKNNKRWIGDLKLKLKTLNLLGDKHIPTEYLHSSYEQRLDLLRGLLDSDGTCNSEGAIEYCSTVEKLALNVCELVLSLGIKTKVKKSKSFLHGVRKKDRYRVTFTTQLPVFILNRKLSNIRLNKSQIARSTHRYILSIEKIDPKPMRCITVDSVSHLFLITRNFIPTHNTMTITCILKKAAQKGFSCLYTTLSDIVSVMTTGYGEDRAVARRELAMVDFLAIDEFDPRFMPTENAADLYARSLENVFRARSQNKLPTLMGTNSPNPVESFNGPLKASIDSLMRGYLQVFAVSPGKDFRKEKA